MRTTLRGATLLIACALLLTACGPYAEATSGTTATSALPTQPPDPTAEPTAAPSPTAPPTIARDVRVAGVNIGGKSPEEATATLTEAFEAVSQPLELRLDEATWTIQPEEIGLKLPIDAMVADAQAAAASARLPLQLDYDQTRLRDLLEQIAPDTARPAEMIVLTSTETLSRSFALVPAQRLDIDAAVKAIDRQLRDPDAPRRIELRLANDPAASVKARPTPEQLQEQIRALAQEWRGIAGIYVYDTGSAQPLAALNERTAFSAASTIKAAILLNSYITLKEFDEAERQDLENMIVESDNLAANDMLAASIGGTTTEQAFEGADEMSDRLASLGLETTYLYIPFEATDFIRIYQPSFRTGPERDGQPPYTDSGRYLRTTPVEIAQLYIWLDQCAADKGILLERFGDTLSAARCKEMIDRLEQNGDKTRIVAGVSDKATVAHKSGWMDDTQGDVGLVQSPGGNYVVAIYVYREIIPGKTFLADEVATPAITAFSRLIYSYYNPAVVR